MRTTGITYRGFLTTSNVHILNFITAKLNLVQVFCVSFHFSHCQLPPCYFPPAAEGCGREIIKLLPYVRSSLFCINLNISFIYEDIFTKFAGNVYGYENLSRKKFTLILKNKMAAIANCLKIVKVL